MVTSITHCNSNDINNSSSDNNNSNSSGGNSNGNNCALSSSSASMTTTTITNSGITSCSTVAVAIETLAPTTLTTTTLSSSPSPLLQLSSTCNSAVTASNYNGDSSHNAKVSAKFIKQPPTLSLPSSLSSICSSSLSTSSSSSSSSSFSSNSLSLLDAKIVLADTNTTVAIVGNTETPTSSVSASVTSVAVTIANTTRTSSAQLLLNGIVAAATSNNFQQRILQEHHHSHNQQHPTNHNQQRLLEVKDQRTLQLALELSMISLNHTTAAAIDVVIPTSPTISSSSTTATIAQNFNNLQRMQQHPHQQQQQQSHNHHLLLQQHHNVQQQQPFVKQKHTATTARIEQKRQQQSLDLNALSAISVAFAAAAVANNNNNSSNINCKSSRAHQHNFTITTAAMTLPITSSSSTSASVLPLISDGIATGMLPFTIEDRSRKSQNMTECVPVPSSEHVAEIVGRQGCKIKALRAKTNTYIKTPVRGEEPVFVVTGRKEDVAKAKREILSAAEHFSLIRATRKPSIENVGSVAREGGRCGSNGCGANDSGIGDGREGNFVTTGIGGGIITSSNGGINSDNPDVAVFGDTTISTRLPFRPLNISGHVTLQVRVPYRVVGLVVGPKGATIKHIQQETQTYIVTPSREKEPIFAVTGLPENVQSARKQIEAHIAIRTGVGPSSGGGTDTVNDTGSPLILSNSSMSLAGALAALSPSATFTPAVIDDSSSSSSSVAVTLNQILNEEINKDFLATLYKNGISSAAFDYMNADATGMVVGAEATTNKNSMPNMSPPVVTIDGLHSSTSNANTPAAAAAIFPATNTNAINKNNDYFNNMLLINNYNNSMGINIHTNINDALFDSPCANTGDGGGGTLLNEQQLHTTIQDYFGSGAVDTIANISGIQHHNQQQKQQQHYLNLRHRVSHNPIIQHNQLDINPANTTTPTTTTAAMMMVMEYGGGDVGNSANTVSNNVAMVRSCSSASSTTSSKSTNNGGVSSCNSNSSSSRPELMNIWKNLTSGNCDCGMIVGSGGCSETNGISIANHVLMSSATATTVAGRTITTTSTSFESDEGIGESPNNNMWQQAISTTSTGSTAATAAVLTTTLTAGIINGLINSPAQSLSPTESLLTDGGGNAVILQQHQQKRDLVKQQPQEQQLDQYNFSSNIQQLLLNTTATTIDATDPMSTSIFRLRRDCLICNEKEVTAALVPCGHNMFCMDCAQHICTAGDAAICPICNSTVYHAMRILA